jgi:putative ABC transport system permease protein
MFRNYLKAAFRNVINNRLYTAINMLGLALALAACLLIGVYVNNELSYDNFNSNAKRIVRVTMEYQGSGTVSTTALTGTKVGPVCKRTFGEVEDYARTFIRTATIRTDNKIFDEPHVLFADPSFFKIFSFNIIQGDAVSALDAPDKIVITRSMEKKYFGTGSGLNRVLTMDGKNMRVAAVCEDAPQASQIKFDFVTRFLNLGDNAKQEIWWSANWITYLLLHDQQSIAQAQNHITAYMKTPEVRKETGEEGSDYLTYHLEPLTKVHLYSSLAGFEPNGSITYIFMFAAIALLILIIACANYTNLATAQSMKRSAEIGMRKVMGASKRQIFVQFLGESFLLTSIAALVALAISLLVLPYFNYITGRFFTLASLLGPAALVSLVIFAVLVSFFAGLYPALILSGLQIMNVIKKGFSFTGTGAALRKTLIVVQFSLSVFLIIFTAIILEQMHYIQTKDLGYRKDNVVVLPMTVGMRKDFQNVKDAFARVPNVESITAAYETPEYIQWGDEITANDEKGKHEVSLNALPVDLDFINTMKMKLIAGRDFQLADFAAMDTSHNNANFKQAYIINETLAKKIGWTPQQAIGRTIKKNFEGPVVGVIKDFNFSSLHNPIGPLMMFLGRDFDQEFLVRISSGDVQKTLSGLEGVWNQRAPERPFRYHFLDDDYNNLYISEHRSSTLFGIAAGIAIILACLGLFGLAAFTTVQRTKEIGIRRVLGANTPGIVLLISKHFLQMVCIGILIAFPAAWWIAGKWLQDFAYRIPVEGYVFIGTALITLLIVFCTVGFHAVRIAYANPVKSLRSE